MPPPHPSSGSADSPPPVPPAPVTPLGEDLQARARQLSWLLVDVDGVLTDGRLIYGDQGETTKRFDVKDGLGFKLAHKSGLRIGVLSGRRSAALARRIEELGFDEQIVGRNDKNRAFDEFLERRHLKASQVAYIGDDLIDLPVLLRCGLSFAPADAVDEVRQRVHRVLSRPGGHGAAREMVELLLRARGDWDAVLRTFTG